MGVVFDPRGGEFHAAINQFHIANHFCCVGGVVVFQGFPGYDGSVWIGDADVSAAEQILGLGVVFGFIAVNVASGLFKSHVFFEPLNGFAIAFERLHASGLQGNGLCRKGLQKGERYKENEDDGP